MLCEKVLGKLSDEKFKDNAEVSVSDQIQLISDAHKRLLDGKEAIIPRIQSVIRLWLILSQIMTVNMTLTITALSMLRITVCLAR